MLALATGCGGTVEDPGVTASFRDDISRLERRTTPPGALSHRTLDPAIRSGAAEAAWEVKSDLPWPEYSRWVRKQIEPEFDIATDGARELRATKGFSTDLYFLTIVPDSLDSAAVSIQLRALPR
jgi:hypothetical protein